VYATGVSCCMVVGCCREGLWSFCIAIRLEASFSSRMRALVGCYLPPRSILVRVVTRVAYSGNRLARICHFIFRLLISSPKYLRSMAAAITSLMKDMSG